MGMLREYGYREYPDDLTPGKGGESSLLFDESGNLAGHASFHLANADDSNADDRDDSDRALSRAVVAVAIAAGVVVVAGLAVGTRKVIRTIRARRAGTNAEAESSVQMQGEEVPAPAESVQETASDPQDELVEDVLNLCREADAAMRAYTQCKSPELSEERDTPENRSTRPQQGPQG